MVNAMAIETENPVVVQETDAGGSPGESRRHLRPRASDRFRQLAISSDPRKVTDQSVKLLFQDWQSACRTEEQAKKMLADALEWKQRAAEKIIGTLGGGEIRYKDVLYMPCVVKNIITLKPLKPLKLP